jgi:hypothetical protein
MNKPVLLTWFLALLFLFAAVAPLRTQQAGNFYEKSLHYTNRGLEYWYLKDNGGLERITGIPFADLGCSNCHVRSCDTCHMKEAGSGAAYSAEKARSEAACEKCHGIESLAFARKSPSDSGADVHFAKGMKCMSCHTAREIHGDGTPYNSMQAPGVMDVSCEKCHADLSGCPSSAIHKGKLDCGACHTRDVPSCYNCHFDTKVDEKKSVSLPLKNMLFLINRNGKITTANLHTFVYRNKTMIVFAPAFSHSIMKKGRKCDECHATPILREMKAGTFRPAVWEGGALKNAVGIIPVLDGYNWNFVFLNYRQGKWAPIENPAAPLLNYSGYSIPITTEQFNRLAKPQPAAAK